LLLLICVNTNHEHISGVERGQMLEAEAEAKFKEAEHNIYFTVKI